MLPSSLEIVVELSKVKRYQDSGEVHCNFFLNVRDKVLCYDYDGGVKLAGSKVCVCVCVCCVFFLTATKI